MLHTCGLPHETLARAGDPWRAMRTELLGGQYLDVLHQATRDASPAAALRIDRYKTAAYTVERPLHLGAALAGADPELVDGYRRFGADIGIAFQLRDDLLGVFGDPGGHRQARGRRPARGQAHAAARHRPGARGPPRRQRGAGRRRGHDRRSRRSPRSRSTARRDLLTDLGAVQAVEQRIAALTGSALDALAASPVAEPAAHRVGRAGRHRDPAPPLSERASESSMRRPALRCLISGGPSFSEGLR